MDQPAAFFLWVGVCALVSWRTAFQMPEGFGNAIFGLQLLGGGISSLLMAMGLPPAINPRITTMAKRSAWKLVAVAIVVFLAGNIGGYALDRGMGLPKRYADDAVSPLATWVSSEPALSSCLAKVWSKPTGCSLTFVVREPTDESAHAQSLDVSLETASCGNAALEACAREAFAKGTIQVSFVRRESFAYAGETRIDISTLLVGTGPPPPVERAP